MAVERRPNPEASTQAKCHTAEAAILVTTRPDSNECESPTPSLPSSPTAESRMLRHQTTTSTDGTRQAAPQQRHHLEAPHRKRPSHPRVWTYSLPRRAPGFLTRNRLVSPFRSPIKTSPNPTHRLVATLARRAPDLLRSSSPTLPFSSARSLHAPFLPFKTFASSRLYLAGHFLSPNPRSRQTLGPRASYLEGAQIQWARRRRRRGWARQARRRRPARRSRCSRRW